MLFGGSFCASLVGYEGCPRLYVTVQSSPLAILSSVLGSSEKVAALHSRDAAWGPLVAQEIVYQLPETLTASLNVIAMFASTATSVLRSQERCSRRWCGIHDADGDGRGRVVGQLSRPKRSDLRSLVVFASGASPDDRIDLTGVSARQKSLPGPNTQSGPPSGHVASDGSATRATRCPCVVLRRAEIGGREHSGGVQRVCRRDLCG